MAEKAPTFEELYQRDIKKYVEKLRKTYKDKRTGQEKYFELSYLSWAYGHREMKRIDPNAKEEVVEFPMVVQGHKIEGVTVPYLHTPQGYFVKCNVTINDRTESEWLPVLDNSNRPIDNPTSFQINTSHKRCFVKALAKHGLGLYLYVGEDLPEDITEKENSEDNVNKMQGQRANQGRTISEPTKAEAIQKTKDLRKSIAEIKKTTQKQVDEWLFSYMNIKDINEITDMDGWSKAVKYLITLESKAKEQVKAGG